MSENERNELPGVFTGLAKEEPSVAVRRRVLAVARVRGAALRRRHRRWWLIPAGVAAGGLVALGVALAWHRVGPFRGNHGVPHVTGNAAVGVVTPGGQLSPGGQLNALRGAVDELRGELEFLESLADGIPSDDFRGTGVHRDEVLERVRSRLVELRRLESRVGELSERDFEAHREL